MILGWLPKCRTCQAQAGCSGLRATECKQMYLASPQLQSFSAPLNTKTCIGPHRNSNRSRLHRMQTNVFGLTSTAIVLGSTARKQMYMASPQLQSFSAPPHANKCIGPHRNSNRSRLHGMQINVPGCTAIAFVLGSTACKQMYSASPQLQSFSKPVCHVTITKSDKECTALHTRCSQGLLPSPN